MNFEMRFYCTNNPDGTITVQNAVGGYLGQCHTHTPDDFVIWREAAKVKEDALVWIVGDDEETL